LHPPQPLFVLSNNFFNTCGLCHRIEKRCTTTQTLHKKNYATISGNNASYTETLHRNTTQQQLNHRTRREGTLLFAGTIRLERLELWVNAALWVVTRTVGEYCIMGGEDCSDTRVGERKMGVPIVHHIQTESTQDWQCAPRSSYWYGAWRCRVAREGFSSFLA
jgi:hypothetical protein